MKGQYFEEFFKKSPTAYSYHKVIFDDQGIPYDYEYLAINKVYENMMELQGVDVVDKRFYEVFPNGWEGEVQWKNTFQKAIMNQKPTHFDMHHYSIQKCIGLGISIAWGYYWLYIS